MAATGKRRGRPSRAESVAPRRRGRPRKSPLANPVVAKTLNETAALSVPIPSDNAGCESWSSKPISALVGLRGEVEELRLKCEKKTLQSILDRANDRGMETCGPSQDTQPPTHSSMIEALQQRIALLEKMLGERFSACEQRVHDLEVKVG